MNKHDEIKKLLKASQNMLSNSNSINEINEIKEKYNLISEQDYIPTSGDITKKIDIAGAIEDEIDQDVNQRKSSEDINQRKSSRDKKQTYRISGGLLVLHGKNKSELQITTDEKVAFQETMNEFVSEVSDLVEFNQLNVYSNMVEWSGNLIEFELQFMFVLGRENGIYIKGDMINTDDDFLNLVQKLKKYYEKFKSKWAKVLGNRKLTKIEK